MLQRSPQVPQEEGRAVGSRTLCRWPSLGRADSSSLPSRGLVASRVMNQGPVPASCSRSRSFHVSEGQALGTMSGVV